MRSLTKSVVANLRVIAELKLDSASAEKDTSTSDVMHSDSVIHSGEIGEALHVGRMIQMGAHLTDDDVLGTFPQFYIPSTNGTVSDSQNVEQEVGFNQITPQLISSGGNGVNFTVGCSRVLSQRRSSNLNQTSRRTNLLTSKSLYRFEWFRLLVLMTFILVSTLIIFVIVLATIGAMSGQSSGSYLIKRIFLAIGCITFSIGLWASMSVLSVVFHSKISSLFDRILGSTKVYCSGAFRFLWYLWYAIVLLGGIAFEILLGLLLP